MSYCQHTMKLLSSSAIRGLFKRILEDYRLDGILYITLRYECDTVLALDSLSCRRVFVSNAWTVGQLVCILRLENVCCWYSYAVTTVTLHALPSHVFPVEQIWQWDLWVLLICVKNKQSIIQKVDGKIKQNP